MKIDHAKQAIAEASATEVQKPAPTQVQVHGALMWYAIESLLKDTGTRYGQYRNAGVLCTYENGVEELCKTAAPTASRVWAFQGGIALEHGRDGYISLWTDCAENTVARLRKLAALARAEDVEAFGGASIAR